MSEFENFKKLVDEFTNEWNYEVDTHGLTSTWEFSTSSENFEDKVDYLSKISGKKR